MKAEPGLYLHVPFCSALCPYCDFAVNVGSRERRSRFVGTLLREIELRDRPAGRFDTVYFGGGTPSSLPVEGLSSIVGELRRREWAAANAWITLEANPEDVTREALLSWKASGVGTLSLGIQSFDDDSLRFLGRRHDARIARRAVELSREAGFETLSLDLIYGLPGQSESSWQADLEKATGLDPDHLSCYQLTVHEGTRFGRLLREGRLLEAGAEVQAELFRFTHAFLRERGYDGYEVSNFARSQEHRSRHNTKYWSHVPYLGLGPSAHSFDGRLRSWNTRSFFAWERRLRRGEIPLEGSETLTQEALLLETIMLSLRTSSGLDLRTVEARFGVDLVALNRPLVEKLVQDALLVLDGTFLRPTLDGLAVADGLASAFRLAPVHV